ncbi:MAG: hypothetical protein H7Y00_07025 [Fimbriimonadaceae bacterium]|nr:hypothetical protein [Chitinophagales bacterium]
MIYFIERIIKVHVLSMAQIYAPSLSSKNLCNGRKESVKPLQEILAGKFSLI